ncbi:MAG: zinc ribbon domain-containing protein [Treponemataceae bacterium]
MNEVFDKLRNLQEILSQEYELQSEMDEAPKELSSQEAFLESLKKGFIDTSSTYDEVKSKVAKLRVELADADAARERSEKGMDNITTHREYEALDKEINEAKELEQSLRKELQIKEKSLAELNDKLDKEQALIKSTEEELFAKKTSLDNKIAQSNDKLSALVLEEKKLVDEIEAVPNVDNEIIFKFKRIVKSKHNKGIVAVKGNVCEGCHMILPNQFANDVRNGEEIVFCPYCSRILFYEETSGDEEQYCTMDDTGTLADLDDDFDEFDDGDDDGDERESIKPVDSVDF